MTMADESSEIAKTLMRACEDLEQASRLLEEVGSIGLWSKSDDSSDNRRKRNGIREADWAVSSACRRLAALQTQHADVNAIEAELRAVVAFLEPLPDGIPDTMGDNPELDSKIGGALERIEETRRRATELAAVL